MSQGGVSGGLSKSNYNGPALVCGGFLTTLNSIPGALLSLLGRFGFRFSPDHGVPCYTTEEFAHSACEDQSREGRIAAWNENCRDKA